MVANNGAVAVEQSGNSIVVKGKLADLVEFPSSVAAQGTHKWIGLDIATDLETIEGATWNGYTLTAADVEEASGLGLGAGHIVFWAKADVIVSSPASIEIGAEGKDAVTLTVSFEDQA